MVRKVCLVCLSYVRHPSPPPPGQDTPASAALTPHSGLSTSQPATQRQGWWAVGPLPRVCRGPEGLPPKANCTRPRHTSRAGTGARTHIVRQDTFNFCFLGLSHQALSSRLGLPLKPEQWGETHMTRPQGAHSVHFRDTPCCVESTWALTHYFAFIEVPAVQQDGVTLFSNSLRQKLLYFFMKFSW